MVYITRDGQPVCVTSTYRCQYSTRREAFRNMLRILRDHPSWDCTIVMGPCPNVIPAKKGAP